MNSTPLFWFTITIICIAVQGLYSMLELAAVSFNRVRLEYYVSKKVKRALWLRYLLQKTFTPVWHRDARRQCRSAGGFSDFPRIL